MHGVLGHLVATDNAWLSLLRGDMPQPLSADAIDTFAALAQTRAGLDAAIAAMIDAMAESDFDAIFSYTPWAGDFAGLPYRQPRRYVLAHLFNHHAHHRGQAHSALSLLGIVPPALDLFVVQIDGDVIEC